MSIDAALRLASREYYPPVPELLLLAGLEARQARPARGPPQALDALASLQVDIVAEVGACFRQAVRQRNAPPYHREALLSTAIQLDRRGATALVERCLHAFLALHHYGPIAQVPLHAWADYLTCAAAARTVLLIGAARYRADAAASRPTHRRLHTVTGCFWDIGEDEPVAGIAGWVTPHADDPGLLMSALVVGEPPALNELRIDAVRAYGALAAASLAQPHRISSPYRIEAAA
ncbi:hypothetical protein SAMN04487938_1433 [Lysobacter sp. cf310]|nr:hypothetical protein SAMN04487938_1433 [Lysobacter sp. cf310]